MNLLPLVTSLLLVTQVSPQSQPSCASKVFCQGNLLHTVQLARPFNDSKSFVDLKLVRDESATLRKFEELMNETSHNPTREEIIRFVNSNFENYNEFDDWRPPDWTDSPRFLERIVDKEVRKFAVDLLNVWPKLARKIKQEVIDSPQFFTLLPVEHGFIIPGGRFKEFYYWDSYWIVRGLLISEMHQTVRGMLDNFLSLVELYGFIPNGARIYYLNRSQPPLLTLMVAAYMEATNDTAWLASNIKTIDKELRFWLQNRIIKVTKDGITYDLAHYDSESGSPRPESYYEDFHTASFFQKEEDKKQLYADIKSGAESGLDFTSRWIVNSEGKNTGNLTLLKTRRIIPVDLNSFLCQAFRKLSELYLTLNDFKTALFWMEKSITWESAIYGVFYDEVDGIWYDWDSQLSKPRKFFFPSNFAPLWSQAYDPRKTDIYGRRAAEYFINMGLMDFEGGIPASLSQTGEQWDYPNAWPPLQALVILGLDYSGNCKARNVSNEFAHRWITANMIGYNQTNEMFEKYDALHPGQYGGGGEYTVQAGFGWTNGVALEFIERFFTTVRKEG